MDFSRGFLHTLISSGACDAYYSICEQHPLRPGNTRSAFSAAAVLEAAKGVVSVSRLRGPGSVYQLDGLPDGMALNFILQRGGLETDFTVPSAEGTQRGTFAIACHAASVEAGRTPRNPPYPRPEFLSIDELVAIFAKLDSLVRRLSISLECAR